MPEASGHANQDSFDVTPRGVAATVAGRVHEVNLPLDVSVPALMRLNPSPCKAFMALVCSEC